MSGKRLHNYSCPQHHQKGAGFIEVLVALVILAIGLLGVMSMQARGLSSNQRAIFATEVSQLTYDMADRMLAYGASGPQADEYDDIDTSSQCITDVDNACDADDVVNNDWEEWAQLVDNARLPSAQGVVHATATNDYLIVVYWDDDRSGSDVVRDANQNCIANGDGLDCFCEPQNDTHLDCFVMELRL